MDIIKKITEGESFRLELKSNFTKELAKDACAFANTKSGGEIIIGVDDAGDILGVKTTKKQYVQKIANIFQSLTPLPIYTIKELKINQYKILVVQVKESDSLVAYRNIVYVRNGANNYPLSVAEILEKSAENLKIVFDRLKSKVKDSQFDKNLISNYLEARQEVRGIRTKGTLKENIQALAFAQGGFLTNAGVLCLGKNPQAFVHNATIKLVVFEDETMSRYSERKEITGDLLKMVTEVEDFLLAKFQKVSGLRTGFKARQFLEYPIDAVREALINAIVHRNYFDESDIRIFIFPNRLEIKNPGSFPPGVSVENPEHKPRNPILIQYFYDLGLIENYGSGIRKIKRSVKEHPLVSLKYNIQPYSTTIVFQKKKANIRLDQKNQEILDFLASGEKKNSEIANFIGISRQTVLGRVNELKALKLIEKTGKGGANVFYKIKK